MLTKDSLSVPMALFIWTLSEKLLHSAWRFERIVDRVFENSAAITRLEKLLTTKPNFKPPMDQTETPEDNGITFDNVHFSYDGRDKHHLHIDSLSIEPGQSIGIVGRSGAGKSTLAYIIARLLIQQNGVISIGNVDIRNLTAQQLADLVTIVQQDTIVIDGSAKDNIAYSINGEVSETDIKDAAQKAGLQQDISELQDGIETVIGEHGIRLSGGQKQRLALARAFLSSAQIVILDEPTSALDASTEHIVQQHIKALQDDGKTVIIIAHRLATILHTDRIIVMSDGIIIEDGSFEELLLKDGVFAKLYNQQYTI